MPAQAETVKRKLQNAGSPTKSRSMSDESSPKRKRSAPAYNSPGSSPIKGPLQECTEENSPSFVAKCFYGLKQSQLSKENVPSVSEKNASSSDESSERSGPVQKFNLGNGKSVYPGSRLDELMLQRVAHSPIKQAILRSCSMVEFRKMFRDEYKELEQEIAMEARRVTRRTSRIVTKRDEEEDEMEDDVCDDNSSSDDEVILNHHKQSSENIERRNVRGKAKETESHVHDTGCNKESLIKSPVMPVRRSQRGAAAKSIPGKTSMAVNGHKENLEQGQKQKTVAGEDETDDESDMETTREETFTPAKKSNGNMGVKTSASPVKSACVVTPPSSGRKFFKTRSPLDNCKKSSVVFGKGFNLKFVSKTGKSAYVPKDRSWQQKRRDTTPLRNASHKSESEMGRVSSHKKPSRGQKLSTDSGVQMSPSSGFTFAPGFLTSHETHLEMPAKEPEHCASLEDDDDDELLGLNRSNCCTYETTPPKQNGSICSGESGSPHNSVSSSGSDSINLVPDNSQTMGSSAVRNSGSADWFTSQNGPAPDQALDKNDDHQPATPPQKLFPIFGRRSTRSASNQKGSTAVKSGGTSLALKTSRLPIDSGRSQMMLDAGQKKFGVIQCPVCSMVYCHADPTDEAAHANFHKWHVEVLKFPGWKKERVLQEYPMDDGRAILVLADDPKYARKKVEEVNQVMARELGFPDSAPPLNNPYQKVFFYVVEKQIAGCCVAEPISEGYRIMPGNLDNREESGQRPWCCTQVPEPACVGISRLWVAADHRKLGVATKLVDCVRQWFDYGSLIPIHKLAFSDPTPDGRKFAQKYTRAPTFLVYKYRHQ